MRIAFIAVHGIPIGGGIEKVTEAIGPRLVAKGHTVTTHESLHYPFHALQKMGNIIALDRHISCG
jgi:hypothetical protein